jgi:hypothetical protein
LKISYWATSSLWIASSLAQVPAIAFACSPAG